MTAEVRSAIPATCWDAAGRDRGAGAPGKASRRCFKRDAGADRCLPYEKKRARVDEIVRQKEDLQKEYIRQNTAKMKWNEIKEKTGNGTEGCAKIRREAGEIRRADSCEIKDRQDQEQEALEASEAQEKETEQAVLAHIRANWTQSGKKNEAQWQIQGLHLALASLRQEEQFIHQNMARIRQERLSEERSQYPEKRSGGAGCGRKRKRRFVKSAEQSKHLPGKNRRRGIRFEALGKKKDEKNEAHKRKLQAREDLSERIQSSGP